MKKLLHFYEVGPAHEALLPGNPRPITQNLLTEALALSCAPVCRRRDEYGRVLTPKEAFRQLCHQFHGIFPSKNTQDKRHKQVNAAGRRRRQLITTLFLAFIPTRFLVFFGFFSPLLPSRALQRAGL